MIDRDSTREAAARRQLFLVAAVFMLPLFSAWLYYAYGTHPEAGANHGELVQGIALPDPLGETALSGQWTLLMVEPAGCDSRCEQHLYRARQVWLSLGRKAERVQRIVISEGGELMTGALRTTHPDLIEVSSDTLPEGVMLALTGVWQGTELVIVDPLGNVVMRFAQDYEMRDLKTDLERLLRLSRIG